MNMILVTSGCCQVAMMHTCMMRVSITLLLCTNMRDKLLEYS